MTSEVRRDPLGAVLLRADYTYYANGLLQHVLYGSGASVFYEYDGANRLTKVDHKNWANLSMYTLDYVYEYHGRDLPTTVTESGASIASATSYYDYDNRGRLISEARVSIDPAAEYNLEYKCDQGGNRTRKIDNGNDREVVYHYDVNLEENPYDSENNRLMYYETFDTTNPASPTLLSTTYYEYNEFGNPARITTNEEGTDVYEGTRLVYASNGSAVPYVTDETWVWDGVNPATNYAITYAREFRYDGARARYLVRQLDPVGIMADPQVFTSLGDTWSDYDGDDIYGDFTADADTSEITNTRSYQPGIGLVDDPFGTPSAEYYHTDLIGSTRAMSHSLGYVIPGSEASYTAFGELLTASEDHRFGYAGVYGYQNHGEFPFLHVGHRYYDPTIGRFLQRDPIGIEGGLNVYAYVGSGPTIRIDPDGLKKAPLDLIPGLIEVAEGLDCVAKGLKLSLKDRRRRHIITHDPPSEYDKNCPTCIKYWPKPKPPPPKPRKTKPPSGDWGPAC